MSGYTEYDPDDVVINWERNTPSIKVTIETTNLYLESVNFDKHLQDYLKHIDSYA